MNSFREQDGDGLEKVIKIEMEQEQAIDESKITDEDQLSRTAEPGKKPEVLFLVEFSSLHSYIDLNTFCRPSDPRNERVHLRSSQSISSNCNAPIATNDPLHLE